MSVEVFTNSIKLQFLHDATEQIKKDLEPKIKELCCRQCNSQAYAISGFLDDENSIIAHLNCTNCGFEEDFTVHLDQTELDKGLNEVNKELHKLETIIEDFNRKF